MIKNVFSQIDKLRDEYIAVWEDVCNLESPSGDKEAVDRVGQYFQKLAQKHRWQIEVMEQEDITLGSIVDVFRYGSYNPSRAVGLLDRGEIRKGLRADLVITDHNMNVKSVILGGEVKV